MSVAPGVYVSYDGKWSKLRENQTDAFNHGKSQLLQIMPSMGGGPAPKYDKVNGNDGTGQTYAILRDNTTGDMFNCSYLIQLHPGNYHQILEIPFPPTKIDPESIVGMVAGMGIKKNKRSKKANVQKKRRTFRRK